MPEVEQIFSNFAAFLPSPEKISDYASGFRGYCLNQLNFSALYKNLDAVSKDLNKFP